jgi:hypothetical protein
MGVVEKGIEIRGGARYPGMRLFPKPFMKNAAAVVVVVVVAAAMVAAVSLLQRNMMLMVLSKYK